MATTDETATYIGDLATSSTVPADSGSTGKRYKGGAEIRKTKDIMKATFPNVTGAVTATHTELNLLDGSTAGTAVASKALVVDANKDINLGAGGLTAGSVTLTNAVSEFSTDGTLAGDSDTAVPTEKAVKNYVDTYGVPSGAVMPFAMATPPTGWLHCNGAAVSRTTYAALFAAISTVYGIGDGSTTFNLPDLRGEFIRGWDNAAGNDPDAATRTDSGDGTTTGDNVGTKQASGLQSHTHTYTAVRYNQSTVTGATSQAVYSGNNNYETSAQTPTATGDTRPRNVNMMYCIKA